MELLRLDSDRKTAALVATLESQLKIRDEKISRLESSVSGTELTISWVIPNWQKVIFPFCLGLFIQRS
jgi:hypothetical protein